LFNYSGRTPDKLFARGKVHKTKISYTSFHAPPEIGKSGHAPLHNNSVSPTEPKKWEAVTIRYFPDK
jgi:hypothetical protein